MDSLNFHRKDSKNVAITDPELVDIRGGRKVKKLLGKGAIIATAAGVSNASWFLAIAANRALESSEKSTLWPSIGFGVGSTAVEYAMASFATSGDVDVKWNPKSRIGKVAKKVLSKVPLVVTSWRGAASGAVLDEISGREVTTQRKLAHAALYGGIMAGWVSKPGSLLFEGILKLGDEAIENPIASTGVLTTLAGGLYLVNRSIDTETPLVQAQETQTHITDTISE